MIELLESKLAEKSRGSREVECEGGVSPPLCSFPEMFLDFQLNIAVLYAFRRLSLRTEDVKHAGEEVENLAGGFNSPNHPSALARVTYTSYVYVFLCVCASSSK